MHSLPHFYTVKASGAHQGHLKVTADNLPDLIADAPIGFDGPGDIWSPEDMLMSSVATCTILSFKAISRASKFEWVSIECESTGELALAERKLSFTQINTKVKLVIPQNENSDKAIKLLNKAEANCLISNSLTANSQLECEIVVES